MPSCTSITGNLVDTGLVNERAEQIANAPRTMKVDGIPVAYTESELDFEGLGTCGMVITFVRGPQSKNATDGDRMALIRAGIKKAGCRRIEGVPRVPPPLQGN